MPKDTYVQANDRVVLVHAVVQQHVDDMLTESVMGDDALNWLCQQTFQSLKAHGITQWELVYDAHQAGFQVVTDCTSRQFIPCASWPFEPWH